MLLCIALIVVIIAATIIIIIITINNSDCHSKWVPLYLYTHQQGRELRAITNLPPQLCLLSTDIMAGNEGTP